MLVARSTDRLWTLHAFDSPRFYLHNRKHDRRLHASMSSSPSGHPNTRERFLYDSSPTDLWAPTIYVKLGHRFDCAPAINPHRSHSIGAAWVVGLLQSEEVLKASDKPTRGSLWSTGHSKSRQVQRCSNTPPFRFQCTRMHEKCQRISVHINQPMFRN